MRGRGQDGIPAVWGQSRWSARAALSRSAARSSARSSRSCCCGAASAVPRERLVDALWGERPPGERDQLAPGVRPRPAPRASAPTGSRRAATPTACASSRTSSTWRGSSGCSREARDALAAARPAHADELLASALALWRGDALADLGDSPVRAAAAGARGSEAPGARAAVRRAARARRASRGRRASSRSSSPPSRTASGSASSSSSRSTASGRQQDALDAYQDARRRSRRARRRARARAARARARGAAPRPGARAARRGRRRRGCGCRRRRPRSSAAGSS